MKKLYFLFLLAGMTAAAQDASQDNQIIYISKKGLYQIKYDAAQWQQETAVATLWDAEFHDPFHLITAYFIELDYFVPEDRLKSVIKEQFGEYGKIKNLKISKKKINDFEGHFFECELTYNNYRYKYQGFIFNGKGGSVELQFGVQAEGLAQFQSAIDAFCKGLMPAK